MPECKVVAEKHQKESAEIGGQNYEMADVVFSICGGKGMPRPRARWRRRNTSRRTPTGKPR